MSSTKKITKQIEEAVSKGIKTTINRFREHPFLYFTEVDIHTSLKSDIIKGHSDIFYKYLEPPKKLKISLVHLEYPTNFRFPGKNIPADLNENSSKGQRGNFDIVILDPEFIQNILNTENKIELLKGIIAKDKNKYNKLHNQPNLKTGEELLYVIEVKFIHLQKTKKILEHIKFDNEKLKLAFKTSNHIRPINLIFCYSESSNEPIWLNDLKDQFNKSSSEVPENIFNIFIEAVIDSSYVKKTNKPIYIYNPKGSIPEWAQKIVDRYDS